MDNSKSNTNLYDWDGTIIPRIPGNAKAYMQALKDLKEEDVTHHGKGKTVDLATARPPMFHRSIRETCERLGIDVGEIHHAPDDKVETVRRLGRPIVDDNPEVVDAVRKVLGENMAKAARWTSRIAEMLASGEMSQEKYDWIGNEGLPFYAVRGDPRIVDYNKRAIQAIDSHGDVRQLKQNIRDSREVKRSYRGHSLLDDWGSLSKKVTTVAPVPKPNQYSHERLQANSMLAQKTFKDHWGDRPILVQAPADSSDKFSTHLHSDARTHAEGKTLIQLSNAGLGGRPTIDSYNYGLYNHHPLYESTTHPERTLEKLRNSSVYAIGPNGTTPLSDMPTAAEGSMYKGFLPATGSGEQIGSLRGPEVYTNSPTWWSGLPEVSARYADKSYQSDLSTARLTRIGGPAEMEQFMTKLKSSKPSISDLRWVLSEGGEVRKRRRFLNSTIRKVNEIADFKGDNTTQFASIMRGVRDKGLDPRHVLSEIGLGFGLGPRTLGPKLPAVIPRRYELSATEALVRSLGKKVAPSPSQFFAGFKPNLVDAIVGPIDVGMEKSVGKVTGLLGKLFRR